MRKKLLSPINTAYVIMFLRTKALIILVILTFLIIKDWNKNSHLIGPLGILISALLASYSVILNIDSNLEIKRKEISNKIRSIFFIICRIKFLLLILDIKKEKKYISYYELKRILEIFEEIYRIIFLISINNDITLVVHNKILPEIHFLYLEIYTLQQKIKTEIDNIENTNNRRYDNLQNPLNTKNFKVKIKDCLKTTDLILSYLKESYTNEFAYDGIEKCAEYKFPKDL